MHIIDKEKRTSIWSYRTSINMCS